MVDILLLQTVSIAIASASIVVAVIYYILQIRHQNKMRLIDTTSGLASAMSSWKGIDTFQALYNLKYTSRALGGGRMRMEDLPKGLAASNAGKIAKKLGLISGGRVLDVATAAGRFIDTLMKTLKDYDSFVGIDDCASDESRRNMESARRKFEGKPVQFFQMNAENLQFEDRSFDTICMSHSLHHLANIDRVLIEMKRVLKSGGNFILQECYCDGDQNEAQKNDERKHEWEAQIDSLLGITHNKTLTRQKIIDIAEGLKLKEMEILDSTHPIECLFCKSKYDCEDPKNQATFHISIKDIDNAIKRIENYPDLPTRKRLMEEGDKIKKAIAEYGASSASYLFIIGKT